MGVKRTVVGTSVNRAIPDDRLPNASQSGTLKAILDEDPDSSIMDHIQEGLVTSIGMRAERVYDYAERGDYLYGLPSGKFLTGADARPVLQKVLTGIEGTTVLLDYAQHGAPNDLHIGWMHLMQVQGYDPATNILGVLTAAKGTSVYLDDMVVVIPTSQANSLEPMSLEQWGMAARAGYTPERTSGTPATRALMLPTPVQQDPAGSTEHVLVKVVWQGPAGLLRDSFKVPITGYDSNANYFQARYTVGSKVRYWMYRDGAGTYPTLDAVYTAQHTQAGSFFPFLYFRFNKTSEISKKTSESYKASKKMAEKLNLPYDDIATAIDKNPDIGKIEQAMAMFMVPANTVNALERQYLFEFFDELYRSDAYSSLRFTSSDAAALGSVDADMVKPSVVIQDTRFKMSLEFTGLYKQRVAGSIGRPGTYGSGYQSSKQYHYYREQISVGFYDEIQVHNLRTVFWILGDFKQAVGDGNSAILMIPLDRAITSTYSIPVREKLYARALHYVFNSAEVVHLKWYQTDAFSFVMVIAAIVMTIYSWGTAGAQAWALVSAGLYTAAAVLILTTLLTYLLVYVALKLFVRVFGVKVAFVVAIVAALAGAGSAISSGGVAGAPWASELLSMSSGLSGAISNKLKTDLSNLVGEQKSLLDTQKEATDLLNTGKELLGNNIHLNPFVIFGESSQDYYNRTVHSGNIGVVGIDAVSSYVDIALTLPKLSTSEGLGYAY